MTTPTDLALALLNLEGQRIYLDALATSHVELVAFHRLTVDTMARAARRQHRTIERVGVVADALLRMPIPAKPDGLSITEWCAFEDGWDACAAAAEEFVRAALDFDK